MSRLFAASAFQRVQAASAARTALPLTMAAWFRVGTPQGFGAILSLGGASTSQTCLLGHLSGTSAVQAYLQAGASSNSTASSTTVGAGVWAHGALTCDASTLAVYLNGGGKTTTARTAAFPTVSHTAAGAMANQNQNYHDGRIGEAGVWSVVLTDDEVLALARGVPPHRVRPGALALYWPLWGVASPEPDLSGGGRHGTSTGATAADHAPVGR